MGFFTDSTPQPKLGKGPKPGQMYFGGGSGLGNKNFRFVPQQEQSAVPAALPQTIHSPLGPVTPVRPEFKGYSPEEFSQRAQMARAGQLGGRTLPSADGPQFFPSDPYNPPAMRTPNSHRLDAFYKDVPGAPSIVPIPLARPGDSAQVTPVPLARPGEHAQLQPLGLSAMQPVLRSGEPTPPMMGYPGIHPVLRSTDKLQEMPNDRNIFASQPQSMEAAGALGHLLGAAQYQRSGDYRANPFGDYAVGDPRGMQDQIKEAQGIARQGNFRESMLAGINRVGAGIPAAQPERDYRNMSAADRERVAARFPGGVFKPYQPGEGMVNGEDQLTRTARAGRTLDLALDRRHNGFEPSPGGMSPQEKYDMRQFNKQEAARSLGLARAAGTKQTPRQMRDAARAAAEQQMRDNIFAMQNPSAYASLQAAKGSQAIAKQQADANNIFRSNELAARERMNTANNTAATDRAKIVAGAAAQKLGLDPTTGQPPATVPPVPGLPATTPASVHEELRTAAANGDDEAMRRALAKQGINDRGQQNDLIETLTGQFPKPMNGSPLGLMLPWLAEPSAKRPTPKPNSTPSKHMFPGWLFGLGQP